MLVKLTETLNLEVLLPSLESQKWYETQTGKKKKHSSFGKYHTKYQNALM